VSGMDQDDSASVVDAIVAVRHAVRDVQATRVFERDAVSALLAATSKREDAGRALDRAVAHLSLVALGARQSDVDQVTYAEIDKALRGGGQRTMP